MLFLKPHCAVCGEETQPLSSLAYPSPVRAGCYLEIGIFDSDHGLSPFFSFFPEKIARRHLQLCKSSVNVLIFMIKYASKKYVSLLRTRTLLLAVDTLFHMILASFSIRRLAFSCFIFSYVIQHYLKLWFFSFYSSHWVGIVAVVQFYWWKSGVILLRACCGHGACNSSPRC